MLPTILANSLMVAAVTLFLMNFLNVFLSEKQKKLISDKSIEYWLLIDALKNSDKTLIRLRSFPWRMGLTILFSAPVLYQCYVAYRLNVIPLLYLYLAMFLVCCLIGPFILRIILSPAPWYIAISKLFVTLILMQLSVFMTAYIFLKSADLFTVDQARAYVLIYTASSDIAEAFLLFVASPIIILLIISGGLYALEISMRRVAEYPKGPLLALAGACGGIGALVKIFVH
ncbi:hypothetical protein [Methylobacterium sp. CM6246]